MKAVVLALAAAAALSACASTQPALTGVPGQTAPALPALPARPTAALPGQGTATAALAVLPVKGRAPMTGYTRAKFGGEWASDGHGCDTRNDVLQRDLTRVTFRSGACLVATGTLADPYTGRSIAFMRGETSSALVQIDHVAAIGDLWQTGAQQLTEAQRIAIYNDPLELLAVDGQENDEKGDSDAASWLPPDKPFRCRYVALQVAVKAEYGLWVTQAEHDAIARVLGGCPGEPLPVEPGGR